MSVSTSSPNHGHEKRRSKSSILWIGISFLVSAIILAWTFTAPFRQPGKPLVASVKSEFSRGVDLTDRVERRQSDAQEFRNAAIEMDREFMQSLAKRNEPKPAPGIKEVKDRWNRRVESVTAQVAQWRNAKEGSPEWLHRQRLLESLQDGPQ